MATLRQYPSLEELLDRLGAVQRRRRVLTAAAAMLAGATVVLGSLEIAAAIGGSWPAQPPSALRWTLLAGCLALWASALAWAVWLVYRSRQNLAQTARFIEQAEPKVRNDLINAVLLAEDQDQASSLLVQLAIRESTLRARRIKLVRSVSWRPLERWAVAAGVVTLALIAFATLRPAALRRGLWAVLNPTGYVPTTGGVRLLHLSPGDTTVFAGQDVAISVKVADGLSGNAKAAAILDGQDAALPMAVGQDSAFSLILPHLVGTTRYAITLAGSRWPEEKPFYTITVLEGVKVEGFSIRYDYPPYTGIKGKTVDPFDGPIEAPVGTRATLSLTVSQPPGQAVLEFKDSTSAPMAVAPDGKTFTAALTVQKDSAYRIVLRDAGGKPFQQLPDVSTAGSSDVVGPAAQTVMEGYFPIRASPDQPPTVAFLAPNRDVSLRPGSALAVKLQAGDDYGLTGVALLAGRQDQPAKSVRRWSAVGKGQAVLDSLLTLDSSLRDGDVLVYYATATDNRKESAVGEPQTATSAKFKVLVSDSAKPVDSADVRQELRDRLLALLRLQETQRVATELCRQTTKTLPELSGGGKTIADGQRRIRGELLNLVEKFPWTAELTSAKTVLAGLASNEAALAVEQAGVVAALASLDGREQACTALAWTQNHILRQLQALLAILPTLASPTLAASQPTGADLPPDVRDKLAKLQESLEEFITAQHKAIEACTNLAKKPLDNFTGQDEKLLSDLRAAQDRWEKFLNEAFADFSKLAQQDFSNPVMLQELISVRSDVTMAADALSAKAVEIATALEDNGVENAKTLTANIEKWLPDEPDRKKWAMEDSADQSNIEQAELPSELEDLVGELLEQEEDLFEQMEDLTSKYATSLDTGAGWDATDGPISSMNAQGVTGNQLPNATELSGRSGEGRTGKSSGEFVEDKAIGKGGRRTPTRLGNEPFQKGQVRDESNESPGGATGGGKVSGAGAEGLEGPVPPPLTEAMKRLAGKQATLVHKAERLQQGFKLGDYGGFAFLQAVTLMNRVRNDLEANRYQNVLRARNVTLETMRQTRAALAGELVVEADASSPMPKVVRDRIADAISGPLPEEYRQVLEQYYRRLAEQAGR